MEFKITSKDLIFGCLMIFPLYLISTSFKKILVNFKKILISSITPLNTNIINSILYIPSGLLQPTLFMLLAFVLYLLFVVISKNKIIITIFSVIYSLMLFMIIKLNIIILFYLLSLSISPIFFNKYTLSEKISENWKIGKVITVANILFTLIIGLYYFPNSNMLIKKTFEPIINFTVEKYVKKSIENSINQNIQAFMWGYDTAIDILKKAKEKNGYQILEEVRNAVKENVTQQWKSQIGTQLENIKKTSINYLIEYSLIVYIIILFVLYSVLEFIKLIVTLLTFPIVVLISKIKYAR